MFSKAKTILLVDDDMDDMLLFREAVKKIDSAIVVTHAHCCDAALHILKTAASLPDCIFMDINMPKITGLECLVLLKKSAEFLHVPVIICSTSRRETDIETARREGAFAFFTKPVRFEGLIDILSFILHGIPLRDITPNIFIEMFGMRS